MKHWKLFFVFLLIISSALLYFLHYLLFRDFHHIIIYLIGDIAFLPLEVLLVTIILERILERQQKKAMLNKLNMVIGIFYSEVGTVLLQFFYCSFSGQTGMKISGKEDMIKKKEELVLLENKFDSSACDLDRLKDFLLQKRGFLLGLLENPNLLEHERFTELLWAVFHLGEELGARVSLRQLPLKDYEHLSNDMKRVYSILLSEWVEYMNHLSLHYPYLYSLAIRKNPFDPSACAVIT